jgi:hypothetical protein
MRWSAVTAIHLIEELGQTGPDVSYFRAALLREDVARFVRLRELAARSASLDDFLKHGLYTGWTRNDMRNAEIKLEIEAVLRALFAYERGGRGDGDDQALRAAWREFDARRLKLAGC